MNQEIVNKPLIAPYLIGDNTEFKDGSTLASEAENLMGFIQRFKLDGMTSKEMRKRISEVAISLLEKQRQEIEQNLLLGLDADKERLHEHYRGEAAKIDENLYESTSQTAKELAQMMLDSINYIHTIKTNETKRLSESLEKGRINKEQHNRMISLLEKWENLYGAEIEERLDMFFRMNNRDSLYSALTLLQENYAGVAKPQQIEQGATHNIIDSLLVSPLKESNFRPFKREEIYDRA
ncbi:MAG: hypothetical protein KJO08_10805 [Gammaproteobacteria bacterium]|nr:hypothetical protein [Gammaproteobacteria bacterium]NNJ84439.1 hypothetical protein [Gammaproteobacteria bacterium]